MTAGSTRAGLMLAACTALIALGALGWPAGARAQPAAYPSQPIKLVVAAPPGGEADAVGRALADGLQARLGVPVVIDNRPGAGVSVGASFVSHAAPDGYTLFTGGSGLTASPAVLKAAVDPVASFTPISQVITLEFFAVVRADSRIRTLADLVAAAKAGSLNYGSAGTGSITHFQMEMLKSMAGFDATHIPYKGTAPALLALLSGDVQVVFAGTPALPLVDSGKLRMIAVAMPTRSVSYAQVPTIEESYAGYNAVAWTGLLAPPHLPPAIVDKLHAATAAVVADPAFAAKIKAMGGQAASSTPRAMAERLKTETARFTALGAAIGIQPQ